MSLQYFARARWVLFNCALAFTLFAVGEGLASSGPAANCIVYAEKNPGGFRIENRCSFDISFLFCRDTDRSGYFYCSKTPITISALGYRRSGGSLRDGLKKFGSPFVCRASDVVCLGAADRWAKFVGAGKKYLDRRPDEYAEQFLKSKPPEKVPALPKPDLYAYLRKAKEKCGEVVMHSFESKLVQSWSDGFKSRLQCLTLAREGAAECRQFYKDAAQANTMEIMESLRFQSRCTCTMSKAMEFCNDLYGWR